MRETAINTLTQLFNDNLGNKLTPALATGILTLMNQVLSQQEDASVEPENVVAD